LSKVAQIRAGPTQVKLR